MNELALSHNFTVDDIHKIREYNYEKTKSMTADELRKFYRKKADEGESYIKSLRKNTQ